MTYGTEQSQNPKATQAICASDLPHRGRITEVDRDARCKLITVSIICFLFMCAEIVGGILAQSLAVTTDAAHLMTDLLGFAISLIAIHLAARPASNSFGYGWGRAEVVGALISILSIWIVTGVLVYLAVERVVHNDFEIDATIMLITASIGIAANVVMAAVLQGCSIDHGHSHGGGGGHGHSHGHSHGGEKKSKEKQTNPHAPLVENGDRERRQNINIRAALIHALGDFVQSVGVLTAALIIYFKPEWKLADPICTFLFSVLVIFTTCPIIRDTLIILMEGAPRSVSCDGIKEVLSGISGVRSVHNLCVWSLTVDQTALAAHLWLDGTVHHQTVLKKAHLHLWEDFGITACTIQLEAEDVELAQWDPDTSMQRTKDMMEISNMPY